MAQKSLLEENERRNARGMRLSREQLNPIPHGRIMLKEKEG